MARGRRTTGKTLELLTLLPLLTGCCPLTQRCTSCSHRLPCHKRGTHYIQCRHSKPLLLLAPSLCQFRFQSPGAASCVPITLLTKKKENTQQSTHKQNTTIQSERTQQYTKKYIIQHTNSPLITIFIDPLSNVIFFLSWAVML